VLNSHEIVRRQLLHFEKMGLPENMEIIIVDDGSEPPLESNGMRNLTIHATNDFRPWTQPIARNTGVRMAKGEYVLCTDIDHIVSMEAIVDGLAALYDVRRFKRQFGVLDELGDFTQDVEVLKEWGLPQERIDKRGLRIRPHSNSYIIKRDLFLKLGGSREDRVCFYPNRDEVPLKKHIKVGARRGKWIIDPGRSMLYMFPVGHFCGDTDYNPFGLFHELKRDEYPKSEQLLQTEI
jgi:hypothetical protein